MTTVADLAADVARKVQDAGYDENFILSLFNRCLLEMAEALNLPGLIIEAELITETDKSYVPLPDDYHKSIVDARLADGSEVVVLSGVEKMLEQCGSLEVYGANAVDTAAEDIALRRLWYYPVPSTPMKIKIRYYRKPPALALADPLPDNVLHAQCRQILINYACAQIFDEIEQGEDGAKANTGHYNVLLAASLEILRNSFPAAPKRRPVRGRQTWF